MAANWTAFVAGNVLEASQLNGVVDNFADIAIFCEEQASGTAGGTNTTGSFLKRTLNTTRVNNITGCSIASSVITLPAGTYSIWASVPGGDCTSHKAKLRNTTDSTDTIIGTSERVSNGSANTSSSFVTGVFTIAGTKNFELQQRTQVQSNNNGLGYPDSFGVVEVYSQITIIRVA
jgi:hypothetical protein